MRTTCSHTFVLTVWLRSSTAIIWMRAVSNCTSIGAPDARTGRTSALYSRRTKSSSSSARLSVSPEPSAAIDPLSSRPLDAAAIQIKSNPYSEFQDSPRKRQKRWHTRGSNDRGVCQEKKEQQHHCSRSTNCFTNISHVQYVLLKYCRI